MVGVLDVTRSATVDVGRVGRQRRRDLAGRQQPRSRAGDAMEGDAGQHRGRRRLGPAGVGARLADHEMPGPDERVQGDLVAHGAGRQVQRGLPAGQPGRQVLQAGSRSGRRRTSRRRPRRSAMARRIAAEGLVTVSERRSMGASMRGRHPCPSGTAVGPPPPQQIMPGGTCGLTGGRIGGQTVDKRAPLGRTRHALWMNCGWLKDHEKVAGSLLCGPMGGRRNALTAGDGYRPRGNPGHVRGAGRLAQRVGNVGPAAGGRGTTEAGQPALGGPARPGRPLHLIHGGASLPLCLTPSFCPITDTLTRCDTPHRAVCGPDPEGRSTGCRRRGRRPAGGGGRPGR